MPITAHDIMKPALSIPPAGSGSGPRVDAGMPLPEVLPQLLQAPGRLLWVESGGEIVGTIGSDDMLDGLGRMLVARDDSSLIEVECDPADYSASALSHAVEDADAHLVDLLSAPAGGGRLRVTLRVRHSDPSAAVHSLERYGYDVVYARGSGSALMTVASERLAGLRALLSV